MKMMLEPGMTMAEHTGDIRVIIVEDEAPTRDLITRLVLERTELKLAGIARDGEEALDLMRKENFELVFLDINLPRLSGFEALEKLEKTPYIIFTTALEDRAVDAFEYGAIDYLLKPYSKERFHKAVDRALEFFKKPPPESPSVRGHGLFVAEKENHFLVPYSEIIYVSSHDNSCVVHTTDRDYVTYCSLKLMEDRLPSADFLRIYKQYIINVKYVARVQSDLTGNYAVFLKDEDETELPIGRKYLVRMKELFG